MSLIFLLLACVCALTGCSSSLPGNTDTEETASEISEAVSSNTESSATESITPVPLYVQDADPVIGYDNLYALHTEALDSLPYTTIAAYGDKILLIRENYTAPENEEEDYEEMDLYYDFDLYDLQNNTVTASITTSEDTYSSYSVSGDRLFITDLTTGIFSVYDSDLQLINTCRDTGLITRCGQPFYWDEWSGIYYSYDWNENRMMEIDSETFFWNYSNILPDQSPIAYTADSGCFLYSDVDPDTLRYRIFQVSARTGAEKNAAEGTSYIADMGGDFYAAEISGDIPLLLTGSFSGDPRYISVSGLDCLNVLEDGSLLLSRSAYDSSCGQSTVLFMHYAASGEMLSSFLYDRGDSGVDSDGFAPDSCVPLSGNEYAVLLYNSPDTPSRLLLWDIRSGKNDADVSLFSFASAEEAETAYLAGNADSMHSLEQVDSDGNPVSVSKASEDVSEVLTLIEDPDHYDWGDLKPLHTRAAALEKQYGITILLGPEVPSEFGGYNIEQACDYDAVENALSHLETILGSYPDNFFPQLLYGKLAGIRIYLSGPLSGDQEGMLTVPGGYVCECKNRMIMVMDINFADSWGYMINHEFSHMIDRRLEFIEENVGPLEHTLEGWNELNPEDFDYLYTYAGYEDNPAYDPDYFCDSYGTTFATEDRAEVFGNAMDQVASGYDWAGYFDADSPIRTKMEYYCAWIREGFDTAGWPETTAWEEVLN